MWEVNSQYINVMASSVFVRLGIKVLAYIESTT